MRKILEYIVFFFCEHIIIYLPPERNITLLAFVDHQYVCRACGLASVVPGDLCFPEERKFKL